MRNVGALLKKTFCCLSTLRNLGDVAHIFTLLLHRVLAEYVGKSGTM
jgi:hypothetical protein